MENKKVLTQEELKELSEEQLAKVSGGYSTGDTCPDCKNGILIYDRSHGGYYCSVCSFTTYDPRSNR